MLSPPYRAAVIGRTGRGDYGHGLDLAFRDHPKLKLVAVADDDDTGRAEATKRLGVERAYADYREMLDREKPEFVAVCQRWIERHREMIVGCAERGIHIFTEKPLAPTLADCDAITDACSRHHVKLAIAFQTRYSPRFDRARELTASGAIGDVVELRGRGKEDARAGGEDLFVLGTHIFDMMRGLVGDPAWCAARVTQKGGPIVAPDARQGNEGLGLLAGDRIDAMYGFVNTSAIGYFASSRSDPSSRRFGVHVMGTRGHLFVGMGAHPPAWLVADPSWLGLDARPVEITSDGPGKLETFGPRDVNEGNLLVVSDLIRAVENDHQPRAGLRDAVWAVEMVLAVYAAHMAGRAVELPLRERSRHPLDAVQKA